MSNAAIAIKVGARVAREIAKAIERDRRNRYVLNAPWTVPRLSTPVPHFSNDALQIDGKRVTILPFAGANACDGNTLAPDKYPLPGRMRGKVLFAFIAHDRIYAYLREIAEAWGWTVQAVRKWADDLYYAILDAQGVPHAISWLYYQGVRIGGRVCVGALVLLLACIMTGCGGCASPPDDFFEPGQDLAEPDYTKIAALSPVSRPLSPVPR